MNKGLAIINILIAASFLVTGICLIVNNIMSGIDYFKLGLGSSFIPIATLVIKDVTGR